MATLEPESWSLVREAARDRDPEGRPIRTFRWSPLGTGAMIFPRLALEPGTPPPHILARRAWLVPSPDRPAAFCYWIAHALRQELWRALQAQTGFLPVAQVTLAGNAVEALAAGMGAGAVAQGRLATLFDRRGDWTRWAQVKSRGVAA